MAFGSKVLLPSVCKRVLPHVTFPRIFFLGFPVLLEPLVCLTCLPERRVQRVPAGDWRSLGNGGFHFTSFHFNHPTRTAKLALCALVQVLSGAWAMDS